MPKPTLPAVIERAIDGALDDVRTFLPGVITSYDEDTQRATVQPLVSDAIENANGEIVYKAIPPIPDVPVVFWGHGDGRITWPVGKGDVCELRFSSSSIARWKKGSTSDPGDPRHHHLSDAICVVGLEASPSTSAPTDAIVTHGETWIGGDSDAERMILGETYRSAEDEYIGTIKDLVGLLCAFAVALKNATPTLTGAAPNIAAFNAAATAVETAFGTTPPGINLINAVATFASGTYLSSKGKVVP